jgi:hypothetical protein
MSYQDSIIYNILKEEILIIKETKYCLNRSIMCLRFR